MDSFSTHSSINFTSNILQTSCANPYTLKSVSIQSLMEVTPCSKIPQGIIPSKNRISGSKFNANPCMVTHLERRTPMAQIFSSSTHTPVKSSFLLASIFIFANVIFHFSANLKAHIPGNHFPEILKRTFQEIISLNLVFFIFLPAYHHHYRKPTKGGGAL